MSIPDYFTNMGGGGLARQIWNLAFHRALKSLHEWEPGHGGDYCIHAQQIWWFDTDKEGTNRTDEPGSQDSTTNGSWNLFFQPEQETQVVDSDSRPARALVKLADTYREYENPTDFYLDQFYSNLSNFYLKVDKFSEAKPNDVVIGGDTERSSFDRLIGAVLNNQDTFETSIPVIEGVAKKALSEAIAASSLAKRNKSSSAVLSISEAFNFEYQAEILRWFGGSGMLGNRHYTASKFHDPKQRVFDAPYAALNMHNHPDYLGMSGLSEQAFVINGYYVRTRHLDYKYYLTIQGEADEINVEHILPPPVPSDVLTKPTGVDLATGDVDKVSDTQARWMSRVFEDNPEECKVYLSCMQVWLERSDGGIPDNVDSFRHENIFDNALDEFKEGTYLTHSGHKNRKENLNFQLNTVATVDDNGDPVLARLAYAMTTQFMGTLAPRSQTSVIAPVISVGFNQHGHALNEQLTDEQAQQLVAGLITEVLLSSDDVHHHHDFRITWDGAKFVGVDQNTTHQHAVLIEENYDGRIPFDFAKAVAGTIDETNRYSLVKDEHTIAKRDGLPSTDKSRAWRFKCSDIERMCERVWGLDGEGSFIQETYDQYSLSDDLQDRDGGQLNSALYNRQYNMFNNDASGRRDAIRGYNDPNLFVASTENPNVLSGKTWMIPEEIVILTPLMTWNPYSLPDLTGTTRATGKGTETEPFNARAEHSSYGGIPFGFWSEELNADPADTTNHMYINDSNGVTRHVWAQGMRGHLPTGERTRIPVYESFFEASYGQVQAENYKERVGEGVPDTLFLTAAEHSELDQSIIDDTRILKCVKVSS